MNFVYQCKVVGLNHHEIEHVVEQGDFVILLANTENPVDSDCIEVYNAERELIGYVANSSKTLSPNNRKNGNISATELKSELDFTNREYYAEAVRVYSSCIYLEVNEERWSFINKSNEDASNLEFVKASEISDAIESSEEVDNLKEEIESLKAIVEDLQEIVLDLKLIAISGGK